MVHNIEQAIAHLNKGGILIYPTDTVYGIGCLPKAEYIESLLEIKPRTTGFIIIVDNFDRFSDWIGEPFSPEATSRPTTWVVKATSKAPKALLNNGNIAIRQVSHQPTKDLLSKLDSPLISTSANLPGKPTATTIEGLQQDFTCPILEGANGKEKPSTIIHYKTKRIIRP